MPKVFQSTFEDVGEKFEKHIDLVKCDPNYVLHYEDGETLRLSTDLVQLRSEIERIVSNESAHNNIGKKRKDPMSIAQSSLQYQEFQGFLKFLNEARIHYETSLSLVLTRNFEAWWEFFTLPNLFSALNLHVVNTLYGRMDALFKTEKLKQAFTFQSMYMGMSPYEAPGTYSLLPYTEIAEGRFTFLNLLILHLLCANYCLIPTHK
jgi:phytoene desaturase (3,4-didehydrolycopene-forming)